MPSTHPEIAMRYKIGVAQDSIDMRPIGQLFQLHLARLHHTFHAFPPGDIGADADHAEKLAAFIQPWNPGRIKGPHIIRKKHCLFRLCSREISFAGPLFRHGNCILCQ
jgi:hypothetical protein